MYDVTSAKSNIDNILNEALAKSNIFKMTGISTNNIGCGFSPVQWQCQCIILLV